MVVTSESQSCVKGSCKSVGMWRRPNVDADPRGIQNGNARLQCKCIPTRDVYRAESKLCPLVSFLVTDVERVVRLLGLVVMREGTIRTTSDRYVR